MKTRTKVLIGFAGFFALFLALLAIFGSDGKNESFQPQEEFRLTPWVEIDIGGIDLSINRAVFYLFLASAATCITMTWIARRMADKPNKTQMAVEVAYDLTRNNITRQLGHVASAKKRVSLTASADPCRPRGPTMCTQCPRSGGP